MASSSAAASGSAAPLALFLATLDREGVTGAGSIAGEALLLGAERLMRLMCPGMPESSGAYVAQVRRTLAAEPLRLVFAVAHEDADAAPSSGPAVPVLGVIALRQYENSFNLTKLHVEGMMVAPEVRSRGVGRALMNEAKRIALRIGATEVVCQVDSQNPGALRFFSKEKMIINCLAFRGPATVALRGGAAVVERMASPEPGVPVAAAEGPMSPLAVQPPANADPAVVQAQLRDEAIVVPSKAAGAAASSVAAPSATIPVGNSLAVHAGFTVLDITDPVARIVRPEYVGLLRAAERVHRQLRTTQFPEGTDGYEQRMRRIIADGAQVIVAVARPLVTDAGADPAAALTPADVAASAAAVPAAAAAAAAPTVLGVGVIRFYRDLTLAGGRLRNWVDDLCTDSAQRSQGVGAAMLDLVNRQCLARGVADVQLDCGCQRLQAHKFYFKSGMAVDALSFKGDSVHVLPEVASVVPA